MVDALRLKIKTLPFGTHAVECHLDESFFNTDEQTEVRRASVDVTLQVTRKSENTYHLEIACNGTLTTACDRCLDDLDLPVDVNYSLDVEQMGNELDDSNDELLIVPAEWRELDAAPLVRDTVLLAMPMTHVHESEDDCNADMLDALDSHRVESVPKKMAHPKRRQSKTRTAKRRTHDVAVAPTIAQCSNCGAWHVYHTVCPECGYYRGKNVMNKEEA